jgi:hypothetical protein
LNTNESLDGESYSLHLDCSKRDLEQFASNLRDGLRVVIWMADELELEATLGFDHASGLWFATGDHSTIKDYY